VRGQFYDYIQYTTEDGLPTNYVYGVVEDLDGQIWAYTEKGICKFDGYEFKTYGLEEGLPSIDVVDAQVDSTGRIWLWLFNGKPAYIKDDSVHLLRQLPNVQRLFMVDGIAYYLYPSLTQSIMKNDTILSSNIFHITESEYLTLAHLLKPYYSDWTHYSAIALSTSDSIEYYQTALNVTFFFDEFFNVTYLLDGNDNILYDLTTDNVISKKLSKDTLLSLSYPYTHQLVNNEFHLINISNGVIEIFQNELNPEFKSGLNSHFKKSTISFFRRDDFPWGQRFIEFTSSKIVDTVPISPELYQFRGLSMFRDSRNNLWMGTRQGGLIFIPHQYQQTKKMHVKHQLDRTFERILPIGNHVLLTITDNFSVYILEKGRLNLVSSPLAAYDIEGGYKNIGRHKTSASTSDGALLHANEFLYITLKDGQLLQHYLDLKEDQIFTANQMTYNEREHSMYVQAHQEWARIDLRTFEGSMLETPCDYVYHLFFSKDNESTGYVCDSFFRIDSPAINVKLPFTSGSISDVHWWDHKLYFATQEYGLYRYGLSDSTWSHTLDNISISKLKKVDDNTFIAATNQGVYDINWEDSSADIKSKYDVSIGLGSNEIYDVYLADSIIYVANNNGFYTIDLDMPTIKNNQMGVLKITDIMAAHRRLDHTQFEHERSHNENDLSFTYHLRSYNSAGSQKYFTRLKPIQQEWQETKERSVSYLDLRPEKYIFELMARDVNGNTYIHEPITIMIKPPFWMTWWFWCATILLFGYAIYRILDYRRKRQLTILAHEQSVNQRLTELKLEALKSQMNPHFIFNALGSIQYYIQIQNVDKADYYLAKFALLIRKYLDASREKLISLEEESELLSMYLELEEMRLDYEFTWSVKAEDGIDTEHIFIPTMVIQPFVENAILHGIKHRHDDQGFVRVIFKTLANGLLCIVEDNGVGMQHDSTAFNKAHKSSGMRMVEEKIAILSNSNQGDISISKSVLYPGNGNHPGTKIMINFKDINYED